MAEARRLFGTALLHVPHATHETPPRPQVAPPRSTAVLATACGALFIIGVNTTAINTALKAIAGDVGIGATELAWAVGSYLLAVAAFVLLGGRLGDMFGERMVMVAGLLVFAGGAVMVAAASAGWMVIIGRTLQGLGASAVMPATTAALRLAYAPERQGFALGIWGAVGGAAFALGPLIGGAFTDAVSWRWVWWTTLVYAGVLALVAIATLRGLPHQANRPRFDVAGIVLLAVSLFSLVLALQQGPAWGWGSLPTVVALVVGVLGLLVLAVIENRVQQPLLHLRMLRLPAVAAANLGTGLNAFALIGILYFFNLYAQAVVTLDYSAVLASVALLPYGACVFASSLLSGPVCDRAGFRWPVAAGLFLMGVGGLLLGRIDASSGYGQIWWPSVVFGIGVGATFAAPSAAGLRSVTGEHAGEVSGIVNVTRYLCAALVVSLGLIIFTSAGSAALNRELGAADTPRMERARLDKVLTGASTHIAAAERGLDRRERAAFERGAARGISLGFAAVMRWLGIVSLVSVPVWLLLMRRQGL